MDKTRIYDLGKLEEIRDMGNKSAGYALERAYSQAKDRSIEDYRKTLIQAHKEGNLDKVEKIEREINSYIGRIYGKPRK